MPLKQRESIESLKTDLRYVDLAFLYDLVMEDGAFLKKVLNQFLKQFPGEMEKLAETVEYGNCRAVATLSHHIQSTVSVLGKNTPFFEQLEKLEMVAHRSAGSEEIKAVFRNVDHHKLLLMQDIDRLLQAELG